MATKKKPAKAAAKPAKVAAKPAKKVAAKKAPAKKAPAKKAPAKKPAAKKPAAKKAPAKKAAPKAAAKPAAPAKKAGPQPPAKKPSLETPKSATKQYTQSEFIDHVQKFCGFTSRRDAKEFYANFTGLIQSALKGGYKIVLPGLGKMQVRKTKARKGINPLTKAPINIPAKRKVAFTAMKALKEAVL